MFPTYSTAYSPSIIPSYHSPPTTNQPQASPPSHPYTPSIIPSTAGESLRQLHDRCAYALTRIITLADAESGSEPIAILLATHAASLIAIGRTLTGVMPADVNVEDFRPFTCGISKFVRRGDGEAAPKRREHEVEKWHLGMPIPYVEWEGGKGVANGWDCIVNGDCSHLEGGEERGWHFSGDESFGDFATTAGAVGLERSIPRGRFDNERDMTRDDTVGRRQEAYDEHGLGGGGNSKL
ncbi:hypothetical protein MMC07_007659 [Pseudocyphellaria aurata]|nr:hypothetical protein [Pseudocyphellaria aurata]